tara:strand:- start:434 stop:703 length:270 start_codon:yes stop_codon:yes gene_type:complete
MDYTKEQLINALCAEYDYLCHDDFNPDVDPTLDEYMDSLQDYTYEQLVEETCTDEGYTLDEFMESWVIKVSNLQMSAIVYEQPQDHEHS